MSAVQSPSERKQKVIDAAVMLFNTNGFSGTSVREIAKKANVNVGLISYYFGGKKGLLEHLMTFFLEMYIERIDKAFQQHNSMNAKDCLLKMINNVLNLEEEHYHLSRLVYREITIDTVLIREIMATYLAKEKYYFKTILEIGIRNQEFKKIPISITILQLKAMLTMPYLHPQYLIEVHHIQPSEHYFTDKYFNEIKRWIEETICNNEISSIKKPILISINS